MLPFTTDVVEDATESMVPVELYSTCHTICMDP